MKKLTKIIKHKHKNYKPTIGLTDDFGKKFSVNSVEYYITLKKLRAEREARKLVMDFIFEK